MLKLKSLSTINLTINDINELASEIGDECERLIASYGIDSTNEIVSKCIIALQMLEKMSNEREKAVQEVQEMQDKISALEKGKLVKVESQKAYEKDLESIEEIWNAESDDLRIRIKRLQDENKKLHELHGINLEKSFAKMSDHSIENITGTLYAEEYKMNIKLKEQVKKLEVEVKVKQNEIEVKDLEIRDLLEEIDELRQAQKQMRRHSRAMETQVKTLYEEREEILAEMQDQHKNFVILRDHMGMASLENEDLAYRRLSDADRPRFTLKDVNSLIVEKSQLAEKVKQLEDEMENLKKEQQEGKFGEKMQKKIDELLSSTQNLRNGQIGNSMEAVAGNSKFKKLSFFDRVQKFISANRQTYPNLWKKFEYDSNLMSPHYDTPI